MDGVVDTTVGYTGGNSTEPTYATVCAGDGHTEAIRLELDPEKLPYEEFIQTFLDDPRVASNPNPREKPQYKTAIWPLDERQREIARAAVKASGKDVPIEDVAARWHDAEDWHQHFLRDFKDLPPMI